jgi:hypothetical protein
MNKRILICSLVIAASLLTVQVVMAQAPAGAPAGATGLCKDGTYYTGANKQGACHGHQGVKEWYGPPASGGKAAPSSASTSSPASSSSSAAPATPPPAPTSAPATTSKTPALGGGADKVWLNTDSNVYHCPGTRYYGTTKRGTYMTEAAAKARGARPDHGKPCQ